MLVGISLIHLLVDLNGLVWQHVLIWRHHLEAPGEMSEPCTQMHVILKFLENPTMMEVSMCEKSVQSSHDVEEMLGGVGWDRYSRAEIATVNNCCGVIERVDHVVHSCAVISAFMPRTNEDELLVPCHLWASGSSALSQELHNEQIELKNELSNVLVLPYALIYSHW